MKKVILPIVFLCAIAIVIVFSCKKTNSNTGPTKSLNQVFAGLRYTPQKLSVTAGRDTVVFGADSTILHFYTNSFKDASGNTIASGTVYLQLVEMYKPGDMICNRATTTSAGDSLLASGGEINITAAMNGQTVYANKYGVGFKQTGSSTQTMQLFYGGNTNADSVTTWTQGPTKVLGTSAHGTNDSGDYSLYFIFDSCTQMGTVNCDYFMRTDTFHLGITNVYVVLPDTSDNASNTMVFFVLPLTKTNVAMGAYNPATKTFSLIEREFGIPVGWNYEIVVITNKNGSYYYWQTSGVTTSGMTVNAAMAPETEGDIIARLQGL